MEVPLPELDSLKKFIPFPVLILQDWVSSRQSVPFSVLVLQIWDLRNMRSPVDSIRLDCGVNRLSVSHDERGILAVPLDNRHIKLYDLTGSRVASVPRRNRQVASLASN